MNRRKFFRLLPLSALGISAMLNAEPEKDSKSEGPSMWVEMTCQREEYRQYLAVPLSDLRPAERIIPDGKRKIVAGEVVAPMCDQKFKALRVAITPICPKCGWQQDISRPGIREKFMGEPC